VAQSAAARYKGAVSAELWLIRHGETEWSTSGQHTGRTDIPLNAAGQKQAVELGKRLAGRPFAAVLCSPLGRARETCRLAGYGDAALPTDDLREWDYGEAEGRTTDALRAHDPGWSVWTRRLPGGETVEAVGRRVDRVIERAAAVGGGVALFAHAHVLRILTARWLGLPPDAGRLFALGTASISVLSHERENRVIERWNLTA